MADFDIRPKSLVTIQTFQTFYISDTLVKNKVFLQFI